MYLCVESVLTFAINIVFNSNFLFSFNNNNNNNNKYNCIAVIIIITNNNNNVIHYILEKYWTQHNYNASRQCPDSSVSSPLPLLQGTPGRRAVRHLELYFWSPDALYPNVQTLLMFMDTFQTLHRAQRDRSIIVNYM